MEKRIRNRLINAAIVLIVVAMLVAVAYFDFSPVHPHSLLGWAAFILLGIPLTVMGQAGSMDFPLPGWMDGLARPIRLFARCVLIGVTIAVFYGLYFVVRHLINR